MARRGCSSLANRHMPVAQWFFHFFHLTSLVRLNYLFGSFWRKSCLIRAKDSHFAHRTLRQLPSKATIVALVRCSLIHRDAVIGSGTRSNARPFETPADQQGSAKLLNRSNHFHNMQASPKTEMTTRSNEPINHQSGLRLPDVSLWAVLRVSDFAVPRSDEVSDIVSLLPP